MADREQRDKILRYYRASGEEELAIRLLDWAEQAQKQRRSRVSFFLDPRGQDVAEVVANLYPDLELAFSGGYPGAERQKATFVHEDSYGIPDFGILAARIIWDGRYDRLGHRDILGAIIGLGLERELFGDVVMKGDMAQVLGTEQSITYLYEHMIQAGAAKVTVELLALVGIEPREERVKEIQATVASLRLDSIAAAGFSTSRSKAASDIETERYKLNWQTVKSPSKAVVEGDIISCRGKGRVEVVEIGGTSKKGRIGILLKRYIG